MNLNNIILLTDGYKASHSEQYPPNTTKLFSYFESRGGEFKKAVFFGMQGLLQRYFSKPFTQADIEEADEFFKLYGEPFPRADWEYILKTYNGFLPIKIRSVPEGTVVPVKNVLFTCESTDPRVPWLESWFETIQERLWYPIWVATNSWYIKQDIYNALVKSSDDPDGQIQFKLHDFGARGVSSHESAEIGGAAHLVNFMGSDNIEGIRYANYYYDIPMAGFSIPAAEHSTITSWGKKNEMAAYRNILQKFGGKYPIFAVVSDSYDLFNAVSNIWGKELKQEVIDCGSMVVIRPDSGDPVSIVGETIKRLDVAFGSKINSKGYSVLNNVRIIQGDGVNRESINQIMAQLLKWDYSIDNIAFGMGGALLQKGDRDTMKCAYKCSSAIVDGKQQDVFKDPITDPGKKSKTGELELINELELIKFTESPDEYQTVTRENLIRIPLFPEEKLALQTVYENGPLPMFEKFSVIRRRASGK